MQCVAVLNVNDIQGPFMRCALYLCCAALVSLLPQPLLLFARRDDVV